MKSQADSSIDKGLMLVLVAENGMLTGDLPWRNMWNLRWLLK